ncbi:type I polyketide synthase [Streptomyces formicae]|uniref:Malonyl CoA-acyl carrier protein transacylase n=1 Tax=Streptomyces formicae TaxID=1616117 RepID=A0A291QIZ2_9ACTN|nr:type I polyketide synthase [Streptomyces formicae]ATL31770.1 Malonyl CoA-acyl carrier protein transacylase [Streptomyces formicae]
MTGKHLKKPGDSSAAAIREWLVDAVARTAGIDPEQVTTDRPLAELGLGSRDLVALGGRLSDLLGRPLAPTLAYDHPTIGELADAVTSGGATAPAPAPEAVRAAVAADDVAIVSMACRFPGADDPGELWRLLADGVDAVSDVPAGRWDAAALYDADPEARGRAYSLRGGFLDGIDRFDAAFFGISPQEAAAMDPQQRLLLQTAWEAIERAGMLPDALRGSATGVYVGLFDSGYLGAAALDQLDGYVATGTSASVASGRIAYSLDLRGPAVTVDTACSSSLVALHLAAQAVREGTCDLALAGGATLLLSPRTHVEFSRLRGMSRSGRCGPFSAGADGAVWGEGCGLVLLKRLSDARRDGDRVLAVVKGSAVNQDGRSQGLSAPSGPAQERVVRAALDAAGLRPGDLDYVEAHGTGTTLGDPVEGGALARVFGPDRPVDRPLAVGSLKSNIGHTQAAAGIGGVIKTVLALRHELLPASLHAEHPTDRIDWAGGGLQLCDEPRPWPRGPRTRRAGVSAFGVSGTNAHVVVEEAPGALPEGPEVCLEVAGVSPEAPEVCLEGPEVCLEGAGVSPEGAGVCLEVAGASPEVPGVSPEVPEVFPEGPEVSSEGSGDSAVPGVSTLFPLSARTPEALRGQARRLSRALEAEPRVSLAAVARTLAHRRTPFERRAVVVARDRAELLHGLDALATGRSAPEIVIGPEQVRPQGKLAFVFPGQGTQWAGMARDLLDRSPLFGDEIDRCDAALRPHTGWSVGAVLRGEGGAPPLERVDVVQPALFAVMVALAAVWRSRGVRPEGVVGHSQGEVAAACVSGALGLNDAAAVVAFRARALRAVAGSGAMAMVALGREEVEERLAAHGGRLSVAALNSRTATVVSGDPEPLDALLADLERERVFVRRMGIDYASHSAQVEPVRETMLTDLAGITAYPSSVAWYSTVTGEPVAEELESEYWFRNLREPVRYADTVERMAADGYRYFVELGPHPALLTATRAVGEEAGYDLVAVGSLRRDEDGPTCLDRAAAELHTVGRQITWRRLVPDGDAAELPTYAWDARRHWTDAADAAGRGGTPFVATHIESSDEPDQHLFEARLDLGDSRYSYLADHRITGEAWLPAAAFVEMALEAVAEARAAASGDASVAGQRGGHDGGPIELADVRFERPLPLAADASVRLQMVLRPPDADGTREFGISARTTRTPWQRHVTGRVHTGETTEAEYAADAEGTEPVDLPELYAALAALGIDYGPAFRGLEQASRGASRSSGRLRKTPRAGHLLHPALLDAAFHTAALPKDAPSGRAFVPAGIGRLRFTGLRTDPARVTCVLRGTAGDRDRHRDGYSLDLRLLDDQERLVLAVEGLELAALSPQGGTLFEVCWQPRPPAEERRAAGTGGSWLILADDSGVGDEIARRLGSTPHVVVRKGEKYAAEGPGRFTIDHGDPAHLERLLDEASAFAAGPPDRVVQLFGLDAPVLVSPARAETVAEAAALCCVSSLNLVRALSGRTGGGAPRLYLVGRGSQAVVDSTDVTHPQQALAWGFGASVAQEHPELALTLIDLPPAGEAEALWAELCGADDERMVALRPTGRFVPRLVRADAPGGGVTGGGGPGAEVPGRVRPDGGYLITGGLGGLGRVVAERLVRNGARHLALLARRAPDADAARWIAGLRDGGVAVHVVQADVTDREALRAALDALRGELPPITGIVHAAGVLDDATLPNLTPERVARVLAPKVLGTVLLTELVPEAESLVLFSSAAGLLGSAGQSPYGAANAFMDAWAHHLARTGRRALSLDWGVWADVGLVAGSAARTAATGRSGLLALSPEEGGDLFERALAAGHRQLVPLALDWEAFARDPDQARSRPLLHGLVPVPTDAPGADGLAARVLAAATEEERTALLEAHVRRRIADVTGGEAGGLTPTTGLKELGLDSLMTVRLRNLLGRDLGVELSASAVFAADDVGALARELRTTLESGGGGGVPVSARIGTGTGTGSGDTVVPDADADADADADVDVELRPATRDVLRLLRAAQHGTPSAAHSLGLALRLTEPTTRERLTDILTRLAGRHAALRTGVVNGPDNERRLSTERAPEAPLLRWSDLDDTRDGGDAHEGEGEDAPGPRLAALLEPPFDLATAPLWRFELLDRGDAGQTLLFGAHHSVSDLQSLLLVAAEIDAELVGTWLGDEVSDRDIDLLGLAQPAKPSGGQGPGDDSAARRAEFDGSRRLDLTLTQERPAARSFRAGSLTLELPDGLMERVAERARQLAITPAAFCLGVLTVHLARLRQRDRFVLAVPVDTRIHVDAFDAVGFFGVPVPFPAQAAPGERVDEVLRRTDGRLARILAKGAMFSDSLAALAAQGLHRENAPLVEVYFNYVRSAAKFERLEVLPAGTGYSDLDLMIIMMPDAGLVRFDHNADIMDGTACAELAAGFLQLLATAADDPTAPARPGPSPVTAPGTLALAATFALGNLPLLCEAALAEEVADGPAASVTVAEAPYHHVLAALKDPSGVFGRPSTAPGVVLLRAADLERFGPVTDELRTELGAELAATLSQLPGRAGRPVIVGFLPAARHDVRHERWERDVAERLTGVPGIAVLRADDWTRHHEVGEWFDERTEELAHLPFTPEFQAAVALTLAEVVRAAGRTPPKVIAVDGDETLWGGIAGEHGPDRVDVGGARELLARRLLQWRAAGTLLVLVSNNDEETVRAVLARPDSVLRAEHFSVISAEWGRKADRIAAAAGALGLGLDSFLFLDDNPVEIAAVRSALPDVLSVTCPPVDELDAFLRRLWPLVPVAATAEDSLRADFYRQEKDRDAAREAAGFEEFLDGLELDVTVRPLTDEDSERAAQLVRRTNQFTLRARSADGGDLERWRQRGEVWTASARDRFGDYGQIGLLAVRAEGGRLDVLAWTLSCRALGRGVEERLLQWLAGRAEELGCATVRLTAERTPRNAPVRRLVAALGGSPDAPDDPDAPHLEVETTPELLRAFRSWRRTP